LYDRNLIFKFLYTYWDMKSDTRIVEPQGAAVARERPIKAFPQQRAYNAAIVEFLETVFSTGSVARLCSQRIQPVES
jgi:hypothetical protein